MTSFGIANVLYDLATDMDYRDYEETRSKEVTQIKRELEYVGKSSLLYKVIEEIVRRETKQ